MAPMQPVAVKFPDITSLTVVQVRAVVPATVFVGLQLANWDRNSSCIHIIRVGGSADGLFDQPELQIDVRATTWDECIDLMEDVRQCMGGLPFSLPQVKRVRETSGVRFLDDVGENLARVTADFALSVAANP